MLRALEAVAPGQLALGVIRTDVNDYLVWIDLGSQSTIAAFRNASDWHLGL